MKTWIFGLVVILAACLTGWLGYRYWYSKPEPPKPPEPPVPPPPTPRELLLEQLHQLRLEIARNTYREECYQQFFGMSGGIQELLAQERRPYKKETAFCRRVLRAAENRSLDLYLEKQITIPESKPISPEEAEADWEMLKLIIRDEEFQNVAPETPLDWDVVVQELQPCLEKILQAAGEDQFQICHSGLEKLAQILKRFKIYPLWFEDVAVQEDSQLQLKYAAVGEYPVPVLCHYADGKYDAVGTTGCIGSQPQ